MILASLLALGSCIDPPPPPAQLGEACTWRASPGEPDRCDEGLACNTAYSTEGHTDHGFCSPACHVDGDCPDGAYCEEGACGWRCASSDDCYPLVGMGYDLVGLECHFDVCSP